MDSKGALPSISHCVATGSSKGISQRPEHLGVGLQEAQLEGEPFECPLSIRDNAGGF